MGVGRNSIIIFCVSLAFIASLILPAYAELNPGDILDTTVPFMTAAHADQQSSQYTGDIAESVAEEALDIIPADLICDSLDTVLLIQDNIPWGTLNDPLGANVEELKFQQKPFCMINSNQIGTTDLNQFEQIIISSAQNQEFYNNLFAGGTINSALATWVQQGRILLANLFDNASGPGDGGNWDGATFVAGVRHVNIRDIQDNNIADATHPIITGAFGGTNGGAIVDVSSFNDLDDWNQSSDGYFVNLPAGATVILSQPDVTGDGIPEPVMIQYSFGNGEVIASMTSTEWRYIGFAQVPVNKKLLANEIGFLDNIPVVLDSDLDGLPDSEEDKNGNGIVDFDETDPNDSDTDDDGHSDGDEVNVFGTNPLVTTARIAAIFAQFTPNVPAPTLTQSKLDQLLTNLTDYYDEVSYGKLELQTIPFGFNENGWSYSVLNNHDFYGAVGIGSEEDLTFSVEAANDVFVKDEIKLHSFNMIIGVHPGGDDAKSLFDTLDMSTQYRDIAVPLLPVEDGVENDNWIVISEEDPMTVWAHEIGHGLGNVFNGKKLPDLYRLGNIKAGFPVGFGKPWDLMGVDNGFIHFSSYTRNLLGWLAYEDISFGNHDVSVLSNLDNPIKRYNLQSGNSFYILETRSKTTDYNNDFDVDIPTFLASDRFVLYQISEDANVNEFSLYGQSINVVAELDSGGSFTDPMSEVEFSVLTKSKDVSNLSYNVSVTPAPSFDLIGVVMKSFSSVLGDVSDFLGSTPPENLIIPDLDLHAYTPDGAHVGINFVTGEYENSIPGAIASGDLINDEEWIFIPSNIESFFVVNSKDNNDLLSDFPELNQLTDGIESFTLNSIFFDGDAQRHTSDSLMQEISPGLSAAYSTSMSQNPDGTFSVVVSNQDFKAGGQRSDVNAFLSFAAPTQSRTSLPTGTSQFSVGIIYGNTIDPTTLQATLNSVDITSSFNPISGTLEFVTIPLDEGRNTLKFTIDGARTDGKTGTDSDNLVFKVG